MNRLQHIIEVTQHTIKLYWIPFLVLIVVALWIIYRLNIWEVVGMAFGFFMLKQLIAKKWGQK